MINFDALHHIFKVIGQEKWSNFEQKNGFTVVSKELMDGF